MMENNNIKIKVPWYCRMCGSEREFVLYEDAFIEVPVRAYATVHKDGSIQIRAVVCNGCHEASCATSHANNTLAGLYAGELRADGVPHERALELAAAYNLRLDKEADERWRAEAGPDYHWIR